MDELGQKPLWRWFEMLNTASRRFDEIKVDFAFTDLIYYEHILTIYRGEDRYYHNLRHIEYMLKYIADFRSLSLDKTLSYKEKFLLKLAIWFHDIVYEPGSDMNEERSAQRAVAFAEALGVLPEDLETLKWLVLVTKHKGTPQTYAEEVICDLDLRELADEEQYMENAILVREEFSMYSDEEWLEGRKNFLEFMLNKEQIYHTDLYLDTREAQARYNLQKELDTITQKL